MKFFNSDKSGFLSFVAKRKKALFALFFIIAGVQTLSAALVKGSWDGWQNHDLIRVAGNEYYVDIVMTNATTDEFGIDFNGSFYSLSDYTITNWCSSQKFYTNNSNCKFTHNKGTYRFRVRDDGNEKTLTITGIIVTIDEPVKNAGGTYTITGRFTNANTIEQQTPTAYQIVIKYGTTTDYENATLSGDGSSFSVTKSFTPGVTYTCFARVIDNKIGNNDSEYITFTAEAATSEPEPTVTDLYIFGVNNNWSNPSDEWKCTSVSENGNVYTWDWPAASKTIAANTHFKIGAKNADNDGIDDNNNYGPSGSDVTLDFNGVQSIVQTVVNSKESKAFYVSEETKISKIEFDKLALTVTFYTPEETQDPVYAATITADASASQQVSLASTLTETATETDLATATCVFQYKAADAGDETYADMSEPASVIYNGEGATRTAILSRSMAAGDYVFRAVWTYNSAKVANAVTGTVTIPSDTPTPTDIEFYVRGEKIGCTPSEGGKCWGVASGEFKATSKEGNVYVWDWTSKPKLMVGPFKIADANFSDANNYGLDNKTTINLTEGKWTGTLQVNTANGDMIIREPGWNVSKITFDYDTKVLTIEAETSSSCQELVNNFTISGQFNAGEGPTWEGSAVDTSGKNNDQADGVFADDHRTITLTTNSVAADSYEWSCTGYSIDGESKSLPKIEWGASGTTTTATLSLPGTYTFVCKATCNGVEATSKSLTITAPAPEIGFDGPIIDGVWEASHFVASDENHKFERNKGSLVWSRDFTYNDGGDNDANSFVIIQRYKLGCVDDSDSDPTYGWAGYKECESTNGENGNKINKTEPDNLTLSGLNQNTAYANFFADVAGKTWQSGVTQLTLTVTMESWNKYSISLAEAASCDIPEGFVISGRLNASDDDGSVWKGTMVSSNDENTVANDGVFADDHRTVTLSTDVVADSYVWTYQYYVDDKPNSLSQENQITWGEGGNTAKTVYATLNLPGKYVFTCEAECGGTTYPSGTVTIETYPEMGMDGPIIDGDWVGHDKAYSNGYMTRTKGTLKWTKTFNCHEGAATVNDKYQFVVIQRYKNGCTAKSDNKEELSSEYEGWAGYEECGSEGNKFDNKINDSQISFEDGSVRFANVEENNYNFLPSDFPSTGAELTLTVTMTGWDSYTVELAVDVELKSSVATEGEPDNQNKGGNLIIKSGELDFNNGDDLSEYVGQDFTISTTPNEGYKLKSITINGTTYTSSGNRVVTLTNAGLEVSAVFTLDCITPMEYKVTGGGKYCSIEGYATVNLSHSQSGINYTLYNEKEPVAKSIKEGTGSSLSWDVSVDGTYTVKAIDKKETCSGQSPVGMSGSASVTSVSSVEIKASPSSKISIYQPMTYTTTVPVVWSSSVVDGDNLITMSQSEKQWIVKAPTSNVDYTIQATMKSPNQKCQSTVKLNVDNVVPWVCNPGAAGLPTSTNGE